MNMCDLCAEMGAVNCKHCELGNPCLGCADYSEDTDTCKSHGGCGSKIENPRNKKEDTKLIIDMTCGARTMWFDKNEPHTVYCDKRKETLYNVWGSNKSERKLIVNPDVQCDFTDLPFNDNSFNLVLFDPPHLIHAKETAWLVKKYGKLDDSWPEMLHDGFAEGMRVLAPNGTLVFKWSEHDIPAEKVWKAIGQKPLFGTHSGKKMQTFFGAFMKFEDMEWETK